MRKLGAGLAIAVLGWAAYLITNTTTHPGPPAPAPTPESPYSAVCPPPPAHPALWGRRGDPCPQVTATMTIGGEST